MTSGETTSSSLPPGGTDRRRATVVLVLVFIAFIGGAVATRSPSQTGTIEVQAPNRSEASSTTTVPAPEMKLKNFWRYESDLFERFEVQQRGSDTAVQYFTCNYTSQTCQRGYHWGNIFLFELLADDRKTVISHQFCGMSVFCLDFDTGVAKSSNGFGGGSYNFTVPEDMSDSCTDACARQWVIANLRGLGLYLNTLAAAAGRRP